MKSQMPHFQPGSLFVDSYSTNHKILHLSSTSQIHQLLHKHGNCTYHEAVQSNQQLTVTSETHTLTLFFCLHPGVFSSGIFYPQQYLYCLFPHGLYTQSISTFLWRSSVWNVCHFSRLFLILCMTTHHDALTWQVLIYQNMVWLFSTK